MSIQQWIVSAFSHDWRGGNPAAVCLLDDWPEDATLQAVAAQNNLSETAFVCRRDLGEPGELSAAGTAVKLRWFTPSAEVNLCGHATLATAHVLYRHWGVTGDTEVTFMTHSGPLRAHLSEAHIAIDLPACMPKLAPASRTLELALGPAEPVEVWAGDDYLVVYRDAQTVKALSPKMDMLKTLDRRGVIVTAPTNKKDTDADDFVSRFFAPKVGVDEDPVTGSAHCQLLPYWCKRLGKRVVSGWQASTRGGRIQGEVADDRVILKGQAVTFSKGQLMATIKDAHRP